VRTPRVVPKRLVYSAFAVVLCAILIRSASGLNSSAAAERPGQQASPETVVLTVTSRLSASAAMPVAVRVGDQLTLTIPSNQTTGFSWRLAKGMKSTVLKLLGSRYVAPSSGFVGAGGSEIWMFTALHEGKTTITLEYVRPWEKDVKPEKRQDFAVVVN